MSKGDETRQRIIERAAAVFNRKGFAGTSVSDLEAATGLRTGGIYRHFSGGKETLALEALEYATGQVEERLQAALARGGNVAEGLKLLAATYLDFVAHPPVPGGCPVLNAAVEHDEGNPALRGCARRAMDRWQALVAGALRAGQARGEVPAMLDPAAFASVFFATLEGALMLSGLYRDVAPIQHAVTHVEQFVDTALRR